MKSYIPKENEIERKWYEIDADGMVLGRLASEISKILSGKNKAIYTPHIDTGDYVIVKNAEKIKVTGNKLNDGEYIYHTGHPGGIKRVSYKTLIEENPEKLIYITVKGMLPKNKLGRKMIKKLKVYKGNNHNHEAQKPEEYKF